MERLEALKHYYTTHDEDARFTPKSGMVEFLTTVHYIEKYLQSGMRILEIGAGTGRYSHHFARKGHKVDAVELMECNIEVFNRQTQANEKITIQQGDAVDLKEISDEQYDITLLFGPLYHLFTQEDKKAALSEALRVTKPNGTVFAAYCGNDMTVYRACFGKDLIHQEEYKPLIDLEAFRLSSTPAQVFALYRKEDVDELMKGLPARRLHYVGTDMLTAAFKDMVNAMDEETFSLYMKYHLSVCERPDMVGATNHILDIFQKTINIR